MYVFPKKVTFVASALKAVFPAPTVDGFHRFRNTWLSLWGIVCHKKFNSLFWIKVCPPPPKKKRLKNSRSAPANHICVKPHGGGGLLNGIQFWGLSVRYILTKEWPTIGYKLPIMNYKKWSIVMCLSYGRSINLPEDCFIERKRNLVLGHDILPRQRSLFAMLLSWLVL